MKTTKLSPFDIESDSLINFIDEKGNIINDTEEFEDDDDIVLAEEPAESTEEEEEEEEIEVDEEEEIDDEGSDPGSNTNPIAILAKSFKEDGILPDDVEIPDNLTDVQFAELYRASKEELIRNEIRAELIEKEGLSPEILNTAKQIHLGVAPKEIEQLNLYNGLGSVVFDEDNDNYEEIASQYLTLYYKDINFDEALINRQVDRDVSSDSDELAEVLAVAKKHFVSKAKATKELHDTTVREAEAKREKDEKEKIDKMNNLLSSGVVKGTKYTKSDMDKVRKALFDKSEIYVDKDGTKRMVSLYQKKRMEIASDFEYSFKQIIDIILGPKESKKDVEIEEKAKKSILSELNKASMIPSMSGKSTKSNSGNISKYGEKVFSI